MKHRPDTLMLAVATFAIAAPMAVSAVGGVMGRVVHLNGMVYLRRGVEPRRAVYTGDQFRSGDLIEVSPKAEMTVHLYSGGRRYRIEAGSTVRVTATGLVRVSGRPPRSLGVLPALLAVSAAGVSGPAQAARFGGTVIRGGPHDRAGALVLVSPQGGVRQSNPTLPLVLIWQALATGEQLPPARLRVRVVDVSTRSVLFERGDLPAGTRTLEIPAGLVKPGHAVEWSVAGSPGMDDSYHRLGPAAVFVLLTPAELGVAARLDALSASLLQRSSTDQDAWLLLGEGYERLGLWSEAHDAFRRALDLGPDSGASAALDRLPPVSP